MPFNFYQSRPAIPADAPKYQGVERRRLLLPSHFIQVVRISTAKGYSTKSLQAPPYVLSSGGSLKFMAVAERRSTDPVIDGSSEEDEMNGRFLCIGDTTRWQRRVRQLEESGCVVVHATNDCGSSCD